MKHLLILLLLSGFTLGVCAESGTARKQQTFKVFQVNIWHEGSKVPDGYQAILNVIDEIDADVVFLCEIRNRDKKGLMANLTADLKERGKHYYGETLGLPVGILSKTEPDSIVKCCVVPGDEVRAMLKAYITIGGQQIAFYSCHLDYIHYECYMPRGYSGTTWKKIDRPITDEGEVLAANRLSFRDESITAFVEESAKDIKNGRSVIMGGDFNEPSHLDWQKNTRNLWDHNGAVINWDCSVMLQNAGFVDVYRKKYPDAVKYPGFTFPAGNKTAEAAGLEKLAWAPDVDERDRIDFIYYHPVAKRIELKDCILVGPAETILYGKIAKDKSRDKFLTPKSVWPSDHKGNLATFGIKN